MCVCMCVCICVCNLHFDYIESLDEDFLVHRISVGFRHDLIRVGLY